MLQQPCCDYGATFVAPICIKGAHSIQLQLGGVFISLLCGQLLCGQLHAWLSPWVCTTCTLHVELVAMCCRLFSDLQAAARTPRRSWSIPCRACCCLVPVVEEGSVGVEHVELAGHLAIISRCAVHNLLFPPLHSRGAVTAVLQGRSFTLVAQMPRGTALG